VPNEPQPGMWSEAMFAKIWIGDGEMTRVEYKGEFGSP